MQENTIPRTPWKLRALLWAVNIALVIAVGISVYVLAIFLQMPSLDSLLKETRKPAITFTDKDGYEIRSANKIMGTPVSVKTVPAHVWQSIIAIEDKRFFYHGAIDMRGIVRSVFSNLRAGRVVSGGSSLTQQVAKNIFLNHKRTVSRKVQELILSYWLENRFSKEQIIDLYMNRVSLVRGLRGIDAAARDIFQKTADDLTLSESAQIAAMMKAPTAYSPIRNPEKNIARARAVLVEMVRQKYISLDEARQAAKELYPVAAGAADTNAFRYWTDYVTDEIMSRLGNDTAQDLIVYTTLDSDLQERAAAVLRRRVAAAKDKGATQGAVVAMARDGALRAMVGGIDYQDSQFNRATALRQPGSTFKAIVYLVALERGFTPTTMVHDSQFSIGDYTPRNYNEKYYGDMTLANAFAKSVNSVPLKLAKQFGISAVLKMAGRLGVGAKLRREYSTVLGASEMTLIELANVYDVIWNNGFEATPYAITKIINPQGRVLYEREPSEPARLLDPNTVNHMTEMLRGVLDSGGTGRRANVSGVAIGGKTGTSSDYRDAWFVGATHELAIGVWVGNDNFMPMNNITGGTIPAEIFHDIVN
ncbi:MAG: PBP1A family penicillin-binding protein [Rickettsiales bacterium]|jgi:penicillin-binding protein 1A|nr:PBP1A family penicillin-binding protein [Rickettsiales bacterium]